MDLKQRAQLASEHIQKMINAGHITLPRVYEHTLPTGDKIPRLGISVYADFDTIEALGNPSVFNKQTGEILREGSGLLKELQGFRMSDPQNNAVIPITVKLGDTEYNAVSTQRADDPNNFSKRDKILLAEVLTSSNAEVSVKDAVDYQAQLKEQRKNLRSQQVAKPAETKEKVPF